MPTPGYKFVDIESLEAAGKVLRRQEMHHYADVISDAVHFFKKNIENPVYENEFLFEALDQFCVDYGLNDYTALKEFETILRPEVLDLYEEWMEENWQ